MPTSPQSEAADMLVLAICCSSVFMVGLDATIVNTALPSMGQDLHASVAGLQWTVDVYSIVVASLMLPGGATADRIGRRRVFQAGLTLFILGSWLCGTAPGLSWLVAFRMLQAGGGSMLNPVALSIITNTFADPSQRGRAIGLWGGVFGVGMALGPVAGGVLIGATGWRSVFWVNIPVGLAALALSAAFVPDSRAPRPRRPDPAGQGLVIVLLASLMYAIIEGPSVGWRSARIVAMFAVAVAAFVAFISYEGRRTEPLIDPRFFGSAPFAAAMLSATCTFAALGAFLFLGTLYLQDVRGLPVLAAGLHLVPMAAAMAVSAPLSGRLVARHGVRMPMVIGGAALALSSAALSQLTRTSPVALLGACYVVFGAGYGMVDPTIIVTAVSGMPPAQAGVASGLSAASRQVGQALGVAIAGSALAGSLHGSLRAGFASASAAGWWVMAGCGYLVLILGFASTTKRALASAASTAARLGNTRQH